MGKILRQRIINHNPKYILNILSVTTLIQTRIYYTIEIKTQVERMVLGKKSKVNSNMFQHMKYKIIIHENTKRYILDKYCLITMFKQVKNFR